MPINQDITQFYSVAATRDFSRDFLFRVSQLKLPGMPYMDEKELVYVKGAELPGRAIQNVPAEYMGLAFNVPGGVKYTNSDSYSLTFYLDANSELRRFFETASRLMFDDQTSTGLYGTPSTDSSILLVQLDKSLNPIAEYYLVGTSIRNINNIKYDIATGTGKTVEITVTFAYHYYVERSLI